MVKRKAGREVGSTMVHLLLLVGSSLGFQGGRQGEFSTSQLIPVITSQARTFRAPVSDEVKPPCHLSIYFLPLLPFSSKKNSSIFF